jgi:predicted transcriptional regulator of viral defense system
MVINPLKKIIFSEFDYNLLLACLTHYKNPRKQITKMLKKKDIIRVKKGLYVFGSNSQRVQKYSLEILANLIYGPSYISCETALSYYGLIPERVNAMISITCKRNKYFKTPVGEFFYKYLDINKYVQGITQMNIDANRSILIATKEKALIDLLYKKNDLKNLDDISSYILENLRIDEDLLLSFDVKQIIEINKIFKSIQVKLLVDFLNILIDSKREKK